MSRQDRPAGVGSTVLAAAAVFVLVLIVSLGGWAFKVATAETRGKGDAHVSKNSAPNRVAAQERFETLHADVLASDRRLDQLAADKKARPDDRDAATRYSGAVSYCHSAVAAYDAEVRKYSSADYRALDLPDQIDPLSPTTDCKESNS